MGDLVPSLLRDVTPKRRSELSFLSEAWSQAAGPEVARRSRVVSCARGTLTVYVESAPLRQELETFRKPEILQRIRDLALPLRIVSLRTVLRPAAG